jgi:hypothetical protein
VRRRVRSLRIEQPIARRRPCSPRGEAQDGGGPGYLTCGARRRACFARRASEVARPVLWGYGRHR